MLTNLDPAVTVWAALLLMPCLVGLAVAIGYWRTRVEARSAPVQRATGTVVPFTARDPKRAAAPERRAA